VTLRVEGVAEVGQFGLQELVEIFSEALGGVELFTKAKKTLTFI